MMRGMNPSSSPSAWQARQPRPVDTLVTGRPTRDGAGVRLTRVLTSEWQQRLDPFLMLDHFASDDPTAYGAGFPDCSH